MSIGQEFHEGKIVKIETNNIVVEILVNEACQQCDGKKSCMIFNEKRRLIDIACNNVADYQLGEIVNVKMATSIGFIAVFYAYLLPVIVLIATFVIGHFFIKNEIIVILISFLIVSLYYYLLYLLRKKIEKKIVFTIQKNLIK